MIHVVNESLGYHLIILLGQRPHHTGWANHTGSKEFVVPVSARGLIHPYLELLFILVLQGHVHRGGGVGNWFTPSSAILGQFTFRSFPCSSSALLCNIGVGRGLEKVEGEGVVTNPCRLHFPTPLLAGSQLGLVSGERLEGRREEPRYLPPTSALGSVPGSGCIFSIVLLLQDHPSLLRCIYCLWSQPLDPGAWLPTDVFPA